MTQYKVGDEVLVRGKIAEVDSVDGTMRIRFQSVGYGVLWIFGKFIYSLAPEFNVGELVEFSNNTVEWFSRLFGAHLPTQFTHPYISVDGCSYRYARKLQPKDEPVTAEEIARFFASDKITNRWQSFVNHFKGRRIGGDK